MKFAFILLGVGSALGRDLIAEKQWKLGSFILLKLVKRKRQITPEVIQTLNDRIITGQTVNQYTGNFLYTTGISFYKLCFFAECVYLLSKNMPLCMVENSHHVIKLMESLVQIPEIVANNLLEAIIPLTKMSHTIRDQLILLLRKALYSRYLHSVSFYKIA